MHERTADTSPTNATSTAPRTGRPQCGACHRPLWVTEQNRYVCRPCEDTALDELAQLPGLFTRLNTTTALLRGSQNGAGPGGGIEAPLPLRVDPLSLTATGGIATRLQAIEDAWRQALGWTLEISHDKVRVFAPWRTDPTRAVPARVRFLTNNLLWACGGYPEAGQDIQEIHRLHREATQAATGTTRPGRIKVGLCPTLVPAGRPADDSSGAPAGSGVSTTSTPARCGTQLTATAGVSTIRCTRCGTRWDGRTAWEELLTAQKTARKSAAAASRGGQDLTMGAAA